MREGCDAAISDIVGTLMMVAAVLAAGSILTVLVTDTLGQEPPPSASFALAPVEAGDAEARIVLKHGADLPLDAITITLQRDDASPEAVPRAAWTTPDAQLWRAGDRLALPLDPPTGPDERLSIRILLPESNAILATLVARTGTAGTGFGDATLAVSLSPANITADGVSAARLAVRVSHEAGAGAIAAVVADLHALGSASDTANATLALNDAGVDGDELGGDGIWTTLLRAPASTAAGTYDIPVNATDLAGRPAGTTSVPLGVTANPGAGSGGGDADPGGGTIVNGTCYGCTVSGGVASYEGTRLTVPTSENMSQFRLRNWTWDKLHPEKLRDDALVIRITNGSEAWSMYFRFAYQSNTPCITYARAWGASNETVYKPTNGTCLSLIDLDLDLIDPTASQQLTWVSGNVHPHSLYPSIGMAGKPTFLLAYLRDEDPTGQDELSQEIGVFSMDVVLG